MPQTVQMEVRDAGNLSAAHQRGPHPRVGDRAPMRTHPQRRTWYAETFRPLPQVTFDHAACMWAERHPSAFRTLTAPDRRLELDMIDVGDLHVNQFLGTGARVKRQPDDRLVAAVKQVA